jgi:hypothetical protein
MLIRGAREILMPLFILATFVTLARFVPVHRTPASYTGGFHRNALSASQQKAVPADIGKDPHFRRLLENALVRVFFLTLPPGGESLVRHEHNFLTIAPEESEVIMWKEDESPIQHFHTRKGEIHFFLGKSALGIRNDSNADYRNVTVEFLDPQVTNYGYRYESGKYDFGPSVISPPVDPEGHFVNSLNLEKAEALDIQLLPQQMLPATKSPQLLIAISALNLSAGEDQKISLRPRDVLWRDTGEPGVANSGLGRARFAIVEFKSTGGKY